MDFRRTGATRLLVPLGLAVALSLFGDLSLFAGLSTRLELVGLTLAEVGVLLSIHRLIRIPGNPLVGLLIDRAGRRPLFLLGMVLAVVSSAGYGLARGFWPFLLMRLFWGAAWALINVGGLTMVLDASTDATRGKISGIYNIWVLFGYAMGPLVGGWLTDTIGFRSAMLACAGFSALGLLAAAFFLPETRSPAAARPFSLARAGALDRLRALWAGAREAIAADPAIATAMVLFGIIQFAGDGVILSTVALLLEQRLGTTVTLLGLALGVASTSGILIALRSLLASASSMLAGPVSDGRLGRRPLIAAGFVLGIAAFAVLAWAGSTPAVLLGIALSAFSSGATFTVLAAYMGDATRSGQKGAAMGAYATAGDIGSGLGPVVAFALIPLAGLKTVYLFSGLIFLAGLGLLALRPGRRPLAEPESAD